MDIFNSITNDSQQFIGRHYFSGAQAHIYIGEHEVTEVISLEGTLMVPKIPIYGYASNMFNTVANGRILATGSLTINYRFPGYLLAYINAFNERKNNSDQALDNLTSGSKTAVKDTTSQTYFSDNFTTINDEIINAYKKEYWANEKQLISTDFINPEYIGPFDIEINDLHLGLFGDETENRYEKKLFKSVYLQRGSTGRIADGSVVVETYSFICKNII